MAETLQPISLEEIKESVARGEVSKWNVDPVTGEMLAEGFTTDSLGNVVWIGEGPEPDIKFAKDAFIDDDEETPDIEETTPETIETTVVAPL